MVDLTDADNETVPMMAKEEDVIVEDVTGEEGEGETTQDESVKYPGPAYGAKRPKRTAQDDSVKYPGPAYGEEMRIRTKPVSYEPVITGKTYKQGVNNLCYRGVRYTLDEVLPSGDENMQHKMGVINLYFGHPNAGTR